ncbi:mechanosensitive ion channel family protein [Myxacorys almedinensis]|uniref:mechanosensitive ion channel family protein n=1 Tax=Myxacorys almedinensis TaxID=2651157 RepID=UPI00192F0DAC|nr:mechanosensitive ion channel domain-containing protein [Myxacorys almedinensis]
MPQRCICFFCVTIFSFAFLISFPIALAAQVTPDTSASEQPAWIVAIAVLIGAIALHWGLGRVRSRLLRVIHLRTVAEHASETSVEESLELLLKLLLSISRVALWIGVALYITNLFAITRQWSDQIASTLLTSFTVPVLSLGARSYSITNLLILAGLVFGWFVFANVITQLLRTRILSLARINRGLREAIAVVLRYSLITIGVLVLLQLWGLDISSLAILASALSVGIGFGLQDIAKNFGSGLVLVFERPIQVGDFVEVGEFQGTVERIGARSTEIRTLDHVSIIVPNSRFLEKEVINWSHGNSISRIHLPVGVAYRSDPKAVEAALLEAAQSHADVLRSPAPRVLFKGFGESALDFELLVWMNAPSRQFLLKSDLNYRIFEVLHQRNIEIPFPQRDLHLRSGTLDVSPELESTFARLSDQ